VILYVTHFDCHFKRVSVSKYPSAAEGRLKKKKVEEKMLKKVSLHKFSMLDAGCLVKIFQCDSRAGRIFNRFRVNVTSSTACSGK